MPVRHPIPPDQLPLGLGADPPGSGSSGRFATMVPTEGPAPFDDDGWFFEPWWPGTPAVAIVAADRLHLTTDHLVDADAAFPELRVLPAQLAVSAAVLAGTLLVLDADGRPDPELLRARLADPGRRTGMGAFVASDLLSVGGEPLDSWPFAQRRARLLEVLADGDLAMASRGLRGEGRTLAAAVASMGLGAISARRLSASWRRGPAPDAYLQLPVLTPTAPQTRPLLVLLQRLALDVVA